MEGLPIEERVGAFFGSDSLSQLLRTVSRADLPLTVALAELTDITYISQPYLTAMHHSDFSLSRRC